MRFLKNNTIITLIMLISLLCACAKGENDLNVEIPPSDNSLIDLASTTYDESQLLEIVKFSGSIDELNTQYPIECIRVDSGTYRVSYLGDESIAVLLYDDSGDKLFGNVYSTQRLRSDFYGLVKCQSLEEVRAVDPDGEYLFLYTGRNDTPKVSSHYTKDGYVITIEYSAENTIISINEELI